MNKEELKGKFTDLKTNVKTAWNKVTEDKTTTGKIKEDLKNKDYSGAANTVKDKLSDTDIRKAS